MKWFRHLIPFVLLMSSQYALSQRATGLVIDREAYEAVQRISPSLKYAADYKPVHSLRQYCPIAGNQGNIGSCVGWSVGYAAYTILRAVRDNLTDQSAITAQARSALYIYNQIKLNPDSCTSGSHIHTAMELLLTQGVCSQSVFNPGECWSLPTEAHRRLAASSKISEITNLFISSSPNGQRVNATIDCLNANRPAVVAMNILPSFHSINSTGLWSPRPEEQSNEFHAMCVVGYDNINQRFEILNSWGPDFGDEGFVYVSYDDYERYSLYGFQMLLEDPQAEATASSLMGGFYLNKLAGYDPLGGYKFEKLNGHWNGRYYEIPPGMIKPGSYFKIIAENLRVSTYLYIFSVKPNGSSELLFPTLSSSEWGDVRDAPIILSGGNYVELPADPAGAIVADLPGTDHLVLLFSTRRLQDIDELVWRVEQQRGELYDRLTAVLGNRMVPPADIRYGSSQMGFSSNTRTNGYVVPVVLKVTVQ